MADTQSTDGLLFIVRTRLLSFTPNAEIIGGDTRTLATRMGTYNAGGMAVPRLWLDTVPDDVSRDPSRDFSLWGLMKLIPAKQHGDDGRFLRRGDIEIQLYGRPRIAASELSGCADVVEQALHSWINSSDEGGFIRPLGGLTRQVMPYDDPKDRELGEIDVRVTVSYMPQFLTQYSNT